MSSVSNSLLASVNNTSAAAATSASTSSSNAVQNEFLTLLTAQLKNQDPSNPMSNSDLTTQMAQMSTVSGISQLNTTLSSLMTNLQSSQALQATNMIGHGVLAAGSSVALTTNTTTATDGTSTSTQQGIMGVNLAGSADAVTVSVQDANGKTIHTANLGQQSAGVLPITWDGTTDSGTKAASGNYTFTVKATSGSTAVAATPLSYGTVASISQSSTGGAKLNVSTIGSINISDVLQTF
ncbi:flagellar hook assembly protein FlgD [Herbaspirillum sp. RTI4]|uniref:flagellar hook assembly protein FlgD n=1 Tax=Herbaspirillum sp. RTI4 TaxID=3048640 RepID=UPI002AB41863|nr:flagellar hook assembly protein FlgD [Herbaspirillum sp. RTI4]MDY7578298.1 flagellar hook assembly protein FlgD [Herbaspirillum sp. RTI4]MEA9981209.1 flagellar hook assembly protein FlgD [Herbaspirillum sp. RTI4]